MVVSGFRLCILRMTWSFWRHPVRDLQLSGIWYIAGVGANVGVDDVKGLVVDTDAECDNPGEAGCVRLGEQLSSSSSEI